MNSFRRSAPKCCLDSVFDILHLTALYPVREELEPFPQRALRSAAWFHSRSCSLGACV